MKKFICFAAFILIALSASSQRLIGKKIFIGMKSEIIGSYFNTNELLKLIIKADTTLIIKSELGEFNYRIEGYEKHRLRKMTWLTLTDMKSPEKIASLQIFMKKGDAYLVVLSEPRLGGLDVSYLHR